MVSDALLDEVAAEIRGVLRQAGLNRTLAIGALVLDRFFNGSVALWRERRNHKNNSVRRLALRPECPLSRSSLNQAIAIYAVVRARPAILELTHVDASHIGVVLPLPAAEQEHWLRETQRGHWSVRQLKEEILRARLWGGKRRGRPKATERRRALSASRALLGRLASSVASLLRLELDAESLDEIDELRERLANLADDLTRASAASDPSALARRDSVVRLRSADDTGQDGDESLVS